VQSVRIAERDAALIVDLFASPPLRKPDHLAAGARALSLTGAKPHRD
jgi:hypothetical protein